MNRLARWFFQPAPAERLAVFRIALTGYALAWVVLRTPFWLDLAQLPLDRYRPVGLLSVPLGVGPLTPAQVLVLAAVTAVAGVAGLVGWRWSVSGPVLAVGFCVLGTHGASWGQVLHTEHLPALHLLVLAATPAGDALALERRCAPQAPSERYGWPLRVLAVVTAATYVVAGLAKVRYAGVAWVDGEVLRNLVAHDNLRKRVLGDPSSPLAPLLVRHPGVFAPAAALTVAVELAAPLALVGSRVRTLWVALAWSFHVAVLAAMAVLFPYPLLGLAFAPLFDLERLVAPLRARWVRSAVPARRRAGAGSPPAGRSSP